MIPSRTILVAEDNDDDFVLLRCAFESAGLPHRLIGVPNGADAIDYLHANEPFSNRATYPFPALMLLDLEMPLMDGFQVLAAIKDRIEFRYLPIVIMSSADDPLIVQEALNLGAKDFFTKPVTMEDRIQIVKSLHSRWVEHDRNPLLVPRNLNPWMVRLPDGMADHKKSE